ncbi:MAG: LacI family transcriptional regulator [Microbacteriaceae bacterium]|nr:MAG: LacI family transcriptional regulator [Microbacteriaceae bacterium]
MADVAAAAGVSITTVSHVLNKTRPVSDELQERVRQAIAVTGYSTNTVARALATQNTMLLGVVMSFVTNPFFAPLVSQIEKTARRSGYTLLLTDSHDNASDELAQVQIMLDHRVDGVIIAPAAEDQDLALNRLAQHATPTVLIDRFGDRRFDEVGVENTKPVAELVAHLVGRGHTRIGFISGQPGLSTTTERLEGYRLGLRDAGLPFDRALVRSGSSQVNPAERAVTALMRSADPPTAIVCANNAMTIGTLRGLRMLGLDVPHDVAVVSFDEIAWGDLMAPALTSMAQPVTAMGKLATQLLLRRIGGHGGPPERHMLAPEFVHRGSCGCPYDFAAA